MFKAIRAFFADRFNLSEDKADEATIVGAIKRDVSFRGANVWTLIFAIFIASIGLNVNSTAVIIGAMLISPLMGPIMGIGLGIGTNDFDLLKLGIKNLAIATIISVITSSVYFAITPLQDASSELLARTTPSLWDVFIAFFGGFAGIVASTRKEKSNVIPGVAIATALMPPLCTAGYGLATGRWNYFFGAAYLFFINSLFICLATFIVVKHLKFHKTTRQSEAVEKRISRYIWIIVIVTVLPSIFLAYRIAQRSFFESNANKFVQEEFHFTRTQVINKKFLISKDGRFIDLLLIGEDLSAAVIDSLKTKLPAYNLEGTQLIVKQGLNAKQEIDLAQIKANILEDVFKKRAENDSIAVKKDTVARFPDLRNELKTLFPDIATYSIVEAPVYPVDSAKTSTVVLFTAKLNKKLPRKEIEKLHLWLQQRVGADTVKLLIE